MWAGISNSNLRIVFLNNSLGRFGDLKNESHFLKKGTFNTLFCLHCVPYVESSTVTALQAAAGIGGGGRGGVGGGAI